MRTLPSGGPPMFRQTLSERLEAPLLAAAIRAGDEPVTRLRFANAMGISTPTASRAARALIEAGVLVEAEQLAIEHRGRPEVALRPHEQWLHIGVAVEDASVLTADREAVSIAVRATALPVTLTGQIFKNLQPVRTPVTGSKDISSVREAIATSVAEVRQQVEAYKAQVHGVGVTLGGHLDAGGVVRYSPNIAGQGEQDLPIPLGDLLQEDCKLHVMIENDANAIARHRLWWPPPGVSDSHDETDYVVVLLKPNGIGAGLVVNGRVYSGAHSMAGEIGHTLGDSSGPICRCGKVGCIEALATPGAIAQRLGAASWAQALASADHKNHDAVTAFRQAGQHLGIGIATLINTLDPQKVYLYGPPDLLRHHDPLERHTSAATYMGALRSAIDDHVFRSAESRFDPGDPHSNLEVCDLPTDREAALAATAQLVDNLVKRHAGSTSRALQSDDVVG